MTSATHTIHTWFLCLMQRHRFSRHKKKYMILFLTTKCAVRQTTDDHFFSIFTMSGYRYQQTKISLNINRTGIQSAFSLNRPWMSILSKLVCLRLPPYCPLVCGMAKPRRTSHNSPQMTTPPPLRQPLPPLLRLPVLWPSGTFQQTERDSPTKQAIGHDPQRLRRREKSANTITTTHMGCRHKKVTSATAY